ncbi:MAG TPA: S-layer homology domain-containing protein, partial [Acidimicrobiales bacterium]|nr:S-layer homology domain-containing protein [Acidimicrobiales bacterium]
MSHRFLLASASAVLAVALVASAVPASAGSSTDLAVDWIESQQQDDGGFEVAGFAGFETPDAVLAIAENGQTTGTWVPGDALDAVQAVTNGDGEDALDYLDTYSAGSISAGVAAKLIVLVAGPLDLPADAFDPAGDGSPVDLEAIMDAGKQLDHSYGSGQLNATLYALLAHAVLGRPAPDDTIAYVRSVQQANGGWNFGGDPNGTDDDPDTTGLAIQALIANGVPPGDADLAAAFRLLAALHRPNGAWMNPFGADDPNSTAVAMTAIEAAGWSVGSPCWRSSSDPTTTGDAFVRPADWIRTQQITSGQDAGRIISPNDGFGVNTFTTSQSVQGLLRQWLPFAPASLQPPTAFNDVPPCAWYTQAVSWSDDHDIANGFGDGGFHPRGAVKRGQAVFWIWNAMDQPDSAPPHGYDDVPANAFYDDALDWAKD